MKSFSSSLAAVCVCTLLAFGFSFPSSAENADPLVQMFGTEKTEKSVPKDSVQATYEIVRQKNISTGELVRSSSSAEVGRENLKAAPSLTAEEIAEIKIEAQKRTKDFLLNISWKKPISLQNILKQLLYVSEDKGKNWNNPKELNKNVNSFAMTGKPNTEYYVKITTVDLAGNESAGIIQSYKVPSLVSTGSPMFLSLGLALLAAAVWQIRRRTRV